MADKKVSSSVLLLNWKLEKAGGRQWRETDFKFNNSNDILRQHTTTSETKEKNDEVVAVALREAIANSVDRKVATAKCSSSVCWGTGSYCCPLVWSCVGRALLGCMAGYGLSGALATIVLCPVWPLCYLKSDRDGYSVCQRHVSYVSWWNPAVSWTGAHRCAMPVLACVFTQFKQLSKWSILCVTLWFPLLPQVRFAWKTISSFWSSQTGKRLFKLTANQQSVGWLTSLSISNLPLFVSRSVMWLDM